VTLPEFGLFLISILMSVLDEVAAEGRALKLGKVGTSNLSSHVFGILTTPELLAGLTCYGLGRLHIFCC